MMTEIKFAKVGGIGKNESKSFRGLLGKAFPSTPNTIVIVMCNPKVLRIMQAQRRMAASFRIFISSAICHEAPHADSTG